MDCITQFEGFQACLHRNPEYAEEMLQGSNSNSNSSDENDSEGQDAAGGD